MSYELICGDCLEVLPTLQAGSGDCVITDPHPQLPARRVLVGEIVTVVSMKIELHVDAAILAEAMDACDRITAELYRLPPMARRVVIENELDEGAIDLLPSPPAQARFLPTAQSGESR